MTGKPACDGLVINALYQDGVPNHERGIDVSSV